VLLSVIDSLLAAIVDSGLDLSPLVCANTLYGLQVWCSAVQCIKHNCQFIFIQFKWFVYQTCCMPSSSSTDSNLSALLTLLSTLIPFLVFRIAALLMKAHGELCTLWLTGAFLCAFLIVHAECMALPDYSSIMHVELNLTFIDLVPAHSCVSFLTYSLLTNFPFFPAQSEEHYSRSERCSNYQTRATRKV
jgi:hypothetical protein